MINLTEAEIHRVLAALDESKYYEPDLELSRKSVKCCQIS